MIFERHYCSPAQRHKSMSRHQDIIPNLVSVCSQIHEDCGVVLIGSVARGTERPDSDIDLNIIFPGDVCPAGQHPYIDDDNHWQLVIKDTVDGIRVDVAWETERALLGRLRSDDVLNCWPFSNGRVLYDPSNVAAPCLQIAKHWYSQHPDIAARFEAAYAEAKCRKRPPKPSPGAG